MKVAANYAPVERFGENGRESDFHIKNTAKAFKVLASRLYKDKILAIVRELSCNAYDSHVAAGHATLPFLVHLPNALEPHFSIRDYGTGLSDHMVRTVFTTFFESTKEDSNDFIGALGLGSKSPFSYVDSYTVITCFGDLRTVYTCFLENGCPKVVQAGDAQPTDEPNGVEIVIPVKPGDVYEFQNKAARIYGRFAVQPIVTGAAHFKPDQIEIGFEGQGYRLVTRNQSGPMAIMGQVAYPIDVSTLPAQAEDIATLLRLSIDIDFPIGALDVQAGREDLSYDPDTIAAIVNRLEEIRDDLAPRFQSEFDKCTTLLEGRILWKTLFGTHTRYQSLAALCGRVTVCNEIITSGDFTVDMMDYPDAALRHYHMDGGHYHGKSLLKNRLHVADDGTGKPLSPLLNIPSSTMPRIFYNDLKTGFGTRLLIYRENHPKATIYLLTGDKDQADAIAASLDGVPYRCASDLEKPEAPAKSKAKVGVLEAAGRSSERIAQNHWMREEVDLAQGGIFMATDHGVPCDVVTGKTTLGIAQRVKLACASAIIPHDMPIYGVPKSLLKTFLKQPGWTEVQQYIRETVAARAPHVADDLVRYRDMTRFKSGHKTVVDQSGMIGRIAETLGQRHPVSIFRDHLTEYGNVSSYEAFETLADHLEIKLSPNPSAYDLTAGWQTLSKSYPLMRASTRLSGGLTDDELRDLSIYIRRIDRIIAKPKAARL